MAYAGSLIIVAIGVVTLQALPNLLVGTKYEWIKDAIAAGGVWDHLYGFALMLALVFSITGLILVSSLVSWFADEVKDLVLSLRLRAKRRRRRRQGPVEDAWPRSG